VEQSYIEKDKQGRPVMIVEISPEEITNLKKAVANHPKLNADDSEGRRFKSLLEKEDWNKLSRMNVSDLKEATNKYIQDHDEPDSEMDVLNDKLYLLRKAMTTG